MAEADTAGGGGRGASATPARSGGGCGQRTRNEKRREKRMRNEPKNVSGAKTPLAINALDFAEARATELKALTETLTKKPGEVGGKRVFQQLPRHMRRRAMSHNIRRLPRRLQDRAAIERFGPQMERQATETDATKKNKKSRKQRRKVSHLRAERTMGRGQKESSTHLVNGKSSWLETHVWHAKRMRMSDYHGYRVAERCCDKGVRQAYRSMKYGCLISDVSYECCVEVIGNRDDIITCLSPLFSSTTGLTPAARVYEDGSRAGQCVMFHFNSFPLGAIGPVEFLWQPINNDDITGNFKEGCALIRRLWLTVSPAIYHEVMHELTVAMEKYCNHGNNSKCGQSETSLRSTVTINSLKNEFVRFRLIGPRSHAVVMETLKPVTAELLTPENESLRQPDPTQVPPPWWRENSSFAAHSELLSNHIEVLRSEIGLPRGTVVSMVVKDPRLFTPTKKTDMVSMFYPKKRVDLWGLGGGGGGKEEGGGGDNVLEDREQNLRQENRGEGEDEEMEEPAIEKEKERPVQQTWESSSVTVDTGSQVTPIVIESNSDEEEEEEQEEVEEVIVLEEEEGLKKDKDEEIETEGDLLCIEIPNDEEVLITESLTETETIRCDKQSLEYAPLVKNENEAITIKNNSIAMSSINSSSSSVPKLPNLASSPLWCASIRDAVEQSKFPDHILNEVRSQVLVPATELSLGHRSPRTPVMLVRKEYSTSLVDGVLQLGCEGCFHGYCKTTKEQVMTSKLIGWDLILPRNWGMAFWIGLVYRGARACGRQELAKVALETGQPFFPLDYPDTLAGHREGEERGREAKQRFLRRPPNKRLNFGKLSIQNPFFSPWSELVLQWREKVESLVRDGQIAVKEEKKEKEKELEENKEAKEPEGRKLADETQEPPAKRARVTINSDNDDDITHHHQKSPLSKVPSTPNNFYVLRSKEELISLSQFLNYLRSHSGTEQRPLNTLPSFQSIIRDFGIDALLRNHSCALVGVVFEMLHRGNTASNDTISMLTISDLKNLTGDPKNFHGPEEELRQRGVTVAEGDKVYVGVSGLTRKEMLEVKKKRRKKKEKAADDSEKPSVAMDYKLSSCSQSRVVIGYTTSCGHCLTSSKDGGIGFVSLVGLVETARIFHQYNIELNCDGRESDGGGGGGGERMRDRRRSTGVLLLIRGQTVHYRFAKFNLLF